MGGGEERPVSILAKSNVAQMFF